MKKRRLFSVFLICMLAVSCYTPEEPVKPIPLNFHYEVVGSSNSFFVTIQNVDNETQQWSNVKSGWKYSWTQTGHRWLYISAQNNKDYGSVTVRIYRENQILKENTSYGAYGIASVSMNY